jgi:HAE1 family hydrophobic/amphiphilic exporter-1
VLAALGMAVVFIYLILASLFGSFLQPLAIMLSLPLSFIGVALALLLTGGNLNVFTMIGIIMLMGLVTKNGILLVDFANQQREEGMERREALLSSARIRPAPHHHDDGGDDLRHGAAGAGAGRGRRAARPDGPRRHRRPDHLHPADAFVVPVVYTITGRLRGDVPEEGRRASPTAVARRPEVAAAD